MLRSLLVIGAFVALLVMLVPRTSHVDRPAVDALSRARATAAQSGLAIELPQGLGAGWVPTVATYLPGTQDVPTFTMVWHTPSGGDIAVKQAATVTPGWVKRSVNDGERAGSVALGGRTFERYAAQSGAQISYLVRGAGPRDLTIVVTGTAPEDEIKALTAALRPLPSTS